MPTSDAELDRAVRVAIGRAIKMTGRIPTIADVATQESLERDAVDASFARMIERRVFIPMPDSHEIYAFNPFCVGPTDFFVTAGGHLHFAICAWDALGIAPALGTEGTIEARCGDCAQPIGIDVDGKGGARAMGDVVVGIGVPARDFWKDIIHT